MRKSRILMYFLFPILAAGLFSCGDDDDYAKLREKELEKLAKYIRDNNITVTPTKTGLYYIETKQGSGDTVKVYDKVHVYYRTWLIDSTLIDSNIDSLGRCYEPLAFTVVPIGASGSGVVDGLNEGVQYMQKGTVATLIIPSELAYGSNSGATTGIPMFSTLLMEVRVDNIFKNTTEN
ncbi:MAG: FKBP-type peptidyl-prolyl cis-trans isomerase [Bacteroidota bacterium]|nr:FKBP-type peptidyl-prolyl cis-trans isomerase [Prolixibacteraceae bacterium]MDI9564582.1 FKBP-type peptidyl-prolyl cis-trans isomerase [Bacteroidota bacterium]OQB79978.1 MAG: FKBP-type 22 kDa peptidyl-prolyl cis-trans isomerase [Bacteroidetes bacterium ADurb.Bin123]HNZ68293.1 FKBP-type peptidyl-prolyl cis-trans isomerase [Prolixibacteraceae bacterium]HOF54365.1 FKBP-type peptidyl-prolyl cis-trans isomerase [Prolixibacteraceae bacterium]